MFVFLYFDNFCGNVDVQFVNLSDTWERINYLPQDLPQRDVQSLSHERRVGVTLLLMGMSLDHQFPITPRAWGSFELNTEWFP